MRRHDAEAAQQFYAHALKCPECVAELRRIVAARHSLKGWLIEAAESILIGAGAIFLFHLLWAVKQLLYDPFRDKREGGK